MPEIRELLKRLLEGSRRLAVLGAGSDLKADDGAGVAVTDALIARFGPGPERFRAYSGGTAPECFTGEIKKFAPDLVLIVDAADFGAGPGDVRSIDPAEVSGVSFSTHMLPLKVMIEYLKKELPGCRVAILGIQPRSLEFGEEMTEKVKNSVEEIVRALGQHFAS